MYKLIKIPYAGILLVSLSHMGYSQQNENFTADRASAITLKYFQL
jgi:hypothetical protein